MLKLLIFLQVWLSSAVLALEATVSVVPVTVSVTSTMHVTVLFDESLGRGGSVVLALPDTIGLQRSSLNKPMKFNPSH